MFLRNESEAMETSCDNPQTMETANAAFHLFISNSETRPEATSIRYHKVKMFRELSKARSGKSTWSTTMRRTLEVSFAQNEDASSEEEPGAEKRLHVGLPIDLLTKYQTCHTIHHAGELRQQVVAPVDNAAVNYVL